MKSAAKFVLIVIGALHLTMCSMGSVGLLDYHLCVKDSGKCDDAGGAHDPS